MQSRALLVALLTFALSLSFAQSPAYVGHWTGTMVGNGGGTVPLEVTINNGSGVWRMTPTSAGSRKNPCFGKDLPMTVQAVAEGVVLEIRGGQVISGCMDQRANLTLNAEKLTGALADGRPVTLTKK
jgi:N-methylhydantoinase A/oxoprolinase/acetone carboxylase beta subunit